MMLHEQEKSSQPIREKPLSIAERIIKPAVVKGSEIFMHLAERNILGPIKPEYPEDFEDACAKLMKDSSVVPILISNHEGHADGAATAIISRDLAQIVNTVRTPETAFRGIMLTIASSIETAHQSIFLQQCTRQAKIRLPKYSLSTQAYTRDKDRREYKMTSKNYGYTEKLMKIISGDEQREADGLAFFVEGTVEGGRRIKEGENKGQIKGMQEINWSRLDILIKTIIRHKKKAVIIPYGSYGAFNILDPDHKNLPTLRAIRAITSLQVPKKSLLTVRVGMPIEYSEMIRQIQEQRGQETTLKDIGNHVGRIIANLLPEEARGVYAVKG